MVLRPARVRAAGMAAMLALLVGAPHPAQAQTPEQAAEAVRKVAPALRALMAPRKGNAVCFKRVYDAAHLKRHPRQKVRALSLLVEVEYIGEDNLFRYGFALRADIKGVRKTQATSGECGWAYAKQPSEGRTIGCSVECDGGGVAIEQDGEALLVRLAQPGEEGRIRMQACGEEDESKAIDLVSGVDDKVFRLARAPVEACRRKGRIR